MSEESMEELQQKINDLIKAYDVAGYVVLMEPGRCGVVRSMNPSWSAFYLEWERDEEGERQLSASLGRPKWKDKPEAEKKEMVMNSLYLLDHMGCQLKWESRLFYGLEDRIRQALNKPAMSGSKQND